MRIVNDAIEDGVGQCWICDDLVPLADRYLAGDEERTLVVTIVDDFEEIAALIWVKRLRAPIINDEEIGALDRRHEAGETSFTTGLSDVGEETRRAFVYDREAIAAGFMAEGTGKPAFAGAGRTRDRQALVFTDPLVRREGLEKGAVETSGAAIIDIFDHGGLVEFGGVESSVRRRLSR
jgi:hypothetical protein